MNAAAFRTFAALASLHDAERAFGMGQLDAAQWDAFRMAWGLRTAAEHCGWSVERDLSSAATGRLSAWGNVVRAESRRRLARAFAHVEGVKA